MQVHDELILLCGDKYEMKEAEAALARGIKEEAVAAITSTLHRTAAYVTERYATLCAERDEQVYSPILTYALKYGDVW
jgi:hypothetical protein